ncbi:MAG TPA: tetratricopeptide repeat protein [Thermoanaerobaculia bacterium]|jgi:tetratricopeptide (TPR) repeat protein|nr:tetratricopeptide repeat protein [Thermoanaerobaculia bacterium]
MRESNETAPHEFETLRQHWHQIAEAGHLEEAMALLETSRAWVLEQGDPRLTDLLICDRSVMSIELGEGAKELPRLREILLRNADAANCRVAAYNIARYYELSRDYKKALFYARIARDRSEVLGRRDWLASSHNLIGNTLLAESFVDKALEEYEKALEFMPAEASPARASILDNLGYCRVLQGRYDEGYSCLYQSLAILRRFRQTRNEISTRLDLCFAHLETGRFAHARRHGLAALRLAESMNEADSVKNALYLLGEAAHLSGDNEGARGYFAHLQSSFYPGESYLPNFLLAVDVRKLVNLHA